VLYDGSGLQEAAEKAHSFKGGMISVILFILHAGCISYVACNHYL